MHTPAELYGSREQAEGAPDEDWLPRVGRHGWAVLGCDAKIFERPWELRAYLQAKLHAFLLPGNALIAERVSLVEVCLAEICAVHMSEPPAVWKLTPKGLDPYKIPGRVCP
ncbi:hypothetical protein HNR21_002531 [Actinomadura cellulosilytica]|uniref:VapC45 PIN like domain-containing protein n=1 Tax=Thermomonospora cellulosilytica TaxID=1411118 RepID=A0A7W3MXH0_9ACTN|nr:hypothetical protein [Thermomonospora cellulosilytica]